MDSRLENPYSEEKIKENELEEIKKNKK